MDSGGIQKFELGGKSMENDYSSFMQKGEDGSITNFDESKMQSYIDSLVSKGVESYKVKAQKESEMSKLNDEQRLAKEREDFESLKKEWEATMKSQRRDLVVEKAKAKLTNFSDAEKELLLKNISDDEKESLKYVDALVAERTKFLSESEQKIIEKLQANQPVSSSQANANENNQKAEVKKPSAQNIKDIYK